MAADRFHDKAFDEGTLTKLEIFQMYTREWLPVFLSPPDPTWKRLEVFDFFAGPGADVEGVFGSPLRTLDELQAAKRLRFQGWPKVRIAAHFFDSDRAKVDQLRVRAAGPLADLSDVSVEIEPWNFDRAFESARPTLQRRDTAKLVFIDQFGVDVVSDDIFRELVSFPTCDVLFFISSSTLYRFRDHPAIKQKIQRPNDHYHVHRAVADYYHGLLPKSSPYFLGHFSIKKGANVYGLIFGSRHPKGMAKFLNVAWKTDAMNGEANFDINRDDFGPLASLFDASPTKLSAFEAHLERALVEGRVTNEAAVIRLCFSHGVKPQHAEPVIQRLKGQGRIDCAFRSPQVDRVENPRPIRVIGGIS
jgi:three-Cys-motif partner protein